MPVCLSVSVSVFVCLFIHLSLSLTLYSLSVCLCVSVSLSLLFSLCVSASPSFSICVSLSFTLSVSVSLSHSLSVSLSPSLITSHYISEPIFREKPSHFVIISVETSRINQQGGSYSWSWIRKAAPVSSIHQRTRKHVMQSFQTVNLCKSTMH